MLNTSERKKFWILLVGVFANSFVEIIGLAAVIPVIGLALQPESIETNQFLKHAFRHAQSLGVQSPSGFLVLLCLGMILAFLFKAGFGLGTTLIQTRYSAKISHRLSGAMWNHHFKKSLEQMRSSNSGQILSEINSWPQGFSFAFIRGGLFIISEVSIIVLICIGLLVYNPIVFLCIATLLALGYVLIQLATKKRLHQYSDIRHKIEPRTNTLISNAVRGFLEILAFRASDATRDLFLRERWAILRLQSNTSVLNQTPAKLYEVLAVTAVGGCIIVTLIQGAEQGFLELLTFMAISAYRIMPSMSRINGAIMQMQAHSHVLETIERCFPFVSNDDAISVNHINNVNHIDIHANNVTLTYQGRSEPVISNLSHTFRAGKIHAIVGPSGSGKSTVVNALLGLHQTQEGQIAYTARNAEDDVAEHSFDLNARLSSTSYLSQTPFLFQGTVAENLTFNVPGIEIDKAQVLSMIHRLQLADCLGDNPFEFEVFEGGNNLSGGQQQRLALIRALQLNRPILLLDEATSALDDELKDIVFDILRERAEDGCNVILVTHDGDMAKRCSSTLELQLDTTT